MIADAARMPKRMPRSPITGPATRSAVRASGLNERELRHPDVVRLSRDTYLPRALKGELAARLAAVVLTAPPDAVVSHLSAADVWALQIPFRDRRDERVHVTIPEASYAESRKDRRLYRIPVSDLDVVRKGAVPVTRPARTWRDLAGILEPPALLAVTDQIVNGLASRRELEEELARRPGGRGCARARLVLPMASPLAGSPMESVLRWMIHDDGLPMPALQYPVRGAGGVVIAAADMAWPERKVLVEFDGDVHRERRTFVNDRRRQNRLVAEGWIILRFTSADVYGDPVGLLAQIRRALGL